MIEVDLNQALRTAQKAALAAREVLLSHFGRLSKVQEKNLAGLVSEADLASEKAISEILSKDFPAIKVLGEEDSFLRQDETIENDLWVVDPLDGTTNYVHGFHVFCISIGLQLKGELVLGVIDVPVLNKTYWAVKDGGAFVNGKPIRVRDNTVIRDSLLATGFFPENPSLPEQIQIFSDLVYEARGIRRAGAAAYDLCLVAEGVFDAFWEPNLKPWDAAAGVVLVREAGGVAWTYDGRDYRLGDNTLMTGNASLASAIGRRIQAIHRPNTRPVKNS
ncbi:MAG: inositol monophosphatase [Bdellovibrionales bacterium]